ncbi:alpha/beta hydrolase [Martelella lutilitoris]|uniref:Alpha/beta hydrolase n=1 Tax=Martelella lutilitoris TaxID=2583532 RepID=A0A7T7HHR4_9HYPH|nr:alpha/beta hydrolase [Martelella lutilitoris]QQM29423.1 alpha/beta hydrolase [Martelella lutilitoris]
MHFTTFRGGRVAYRLDGVGRTVVLVHGTGGDSEGNWGEIAPALSKNYQVLRPDYSGSGQTKDDGRALTVEFLSDQVLAAVDDAGIASFAVVGFSLGAAIAARIAADHPDRVSDLVLIAGFLQTDSRLKLQFELWRDLIETDRKAMARLILLTGFSPDALSSWGIDGVSQAAGDIVDTQDWQGMARQVALDLSLDVSDTIEKIEARTLVIGNTYDHMVAPSHSRKLAAALQDSAYAELPSGHLVPMERPDLVSDLISRFLAGP